MKLFRHGEKGKEKPGILDSHGRKRDLSVVLPDLSADYLGDAELNALRLCNPGELPIVSDGVRMGACVSEVNRFFCIGLNYIDHAEETGLPIPDKPVLFMKACSVSGPDDPIIIPRNSYKTDWEVELGVVIGKVAAHVSTTEALSHVAGYCVVNDVSERSFQMDEGGQWVKGKSCDSFGPIGPYLVTRDEVVDPQKLSLYLNINGHRRQTGDTGKMIFSVAEIISNLSQFITLKPGDLIATGTPPGVGMGMTPPMYLSPGDNLNLGISGLGEQMNKVVSYEESSKTNTPGELYARTVYDGR